MDATATTPETTPIEQDAPGVGNGPESSPAERRDKASLLRFSDFVHVGAGAKGCEHGEDGECEDDEHFHAFIRLPNQFQRESLTEKSDAARARRLRLLRDPESDAATILDGEIEELRRLADHEALVEEVVGFDFLKDHLAAMREVAEDEEFLHIEDDRERLRALAAMDDEHRPEDEFRELEKHVLAYTEQVNEARTRIQQPLRDACTDKGIEDLLEMVREERINMACKEAADAAWSQWEWYIGTLRMRVPTKIDAAQMRVFPSIDALKAAPEEVIEALRLAFRDIEADAGRSLQNAANG